MLTERINDDDDDSNHLMIKLRCSAASGDDATQQVPSTGGRGRWSTCQDRSPAVWRRRHRRRLQLGQSHRQRQQPAHVRRLATARRTTANRCPPNHVTGFSADVKLVFCLCRVRPRGGEGGWRFEPLHRSYPEHMKRVYFWEKCTYFSIFYFLFYFIFTSNVRNN